MNAEQIISEQKQTHFPKSTHNTDVNKTNSTYGFTVAFKLTIAIKAH